MLKACPVWLPPVVVVVVKTPVGVVIVVVMVISASSPQALRFACIHCKDDGLGTREGWA